jgi:hypothetical protein
MGQMTVYTSVHLSRTTDPRAQRGVPRLDGKKSFVLAMDRERRRLLRRNPATRVVCY